MLSCIRYAPFQRLVSHVALLWLCTCQATSTAPSYVELAPLDFKAAALGQLTAGAIIDPVAQPTLRGYFDRPIPRVIHQVAWDDSTPCDTAWQSYAAEHGYAYRCWQPATHVVTADAWTTQGCREASYVAQRLGQAGHGRMQADVLTYAILLQQGGIAVAPGVGVPTTMMQTLDLEDIVQLRGLVLTSAPFARNIGRDSAFFATTDIVMSAPGHPVLAHTLAALPAHVALWGDDVAASDRDYVTGDIFFNLTLGGVYRVVPYPTWVRLGVLPHVAQPADPHAHPPFDTGMQEVTTSAAGALARSVKRFGQRAQDRNIPPKVHQIWFGDVDRMPKEATAMWRAYSETYGYDYRLWTQDDLAEITALMPARNVQLLHRRLQANDYPGVSDVIRLSLLEAFGGLYIDCDFTPPHGATGELLPLHALLPLRGLVISNEKDGRNVGTSSLFAANGIIMAPPWHPVITFAVEQLASHAEMFDGRPQRYHTCYSTGPFLLNRCLEGGFTLLPVPYYHQIQMDCANAELERTQKQ